MNRHDDIRRMLSAYSGDDLSESDRLLVERHLADCQECRAQLAQLQQLRAVLRELPDVEPPPWLVSRIMAQVRDEHEAVPQRSWIQRLFLPLKTKLPIEALALVVVCVTAWYLLQQVERGQQLAQAPAVMQQPAPVSKEQAVKPQLAPSATFQASPALSERHEQHQPAPGVQSNRPQPLPRQASDLQPAATAPTTVQRQAKTESASAAPSAALSSPASEQRSVAKRAVPARERAFEAMSRETVTIRLVVDDPERFDQKLTSLVRRTEGVLLQHNRQNAVIRLQAVRIPEFINGLEQAGKISAYPGTAAQGSEWLELLIYW